MKRDKLESYLEKYVKIILFDGTAIKGTLHKTGEKAFENDPDLSIPKQRYFCTDKNGFISSRCLFKVSHIKTFALAKMTNFEKIKSMSKEQMTHFMLDIMLDTLNNNVCGYCENCDAPCLENEEIIRKWLESEADND